MYFVVIAASAAAVADSSRHKNSFALCRRTQNQNFFPVFLSPLFADFTQKSWLHEFLVKCTYYYYAHVSVCLSEPQKAKRCCLLPRGRELPFATYFVVDGEVYLLSPISRLINSLNQQQ